MQRTIKFINDDASSIHGSLKVSSIYTSESGEWKLGGFEVLSSVKDDEALIYVWDFWPFVQLKSIQGWILTDSV